MQHGDGVVALLFHSEIGHLEVAVLDGFLFVDRPVLATFRPAALQTPGGHDDHDALLLPDLNIYYIYIIYIYIYYIYIQIFIIIYKYEYYNIKIF